MARSYRHGDKQKRKYYGEYYWWWKQEPKAWRKLYKHRPRRAAVRKCRYAAMMGSVDILWPLDKKPRIYYF